MGITGPGGPLGVYTLFLAEMLSDAATLHGCSVWASGSIRGEPILLLTSKPTRKS